MKDRGADIASRSSEFFVRREPCARQIFIGGERSQHFRRHDAARKPDCIGSYAPVGFELLPPRFSLTQLQRLYEIILGTELDKRNFRKKILSMDLLVETDEVEQGVRHRAARLYRFDRRKYERLLKQGFELSI